MVKLPPDQSEHTTYSSYREVLIEHLVTAEIMRYLWLNGVVRMEVMKPQVDDSGYDLVLEANGVVRHVQLKASHHQAATPRVNVHISLAGKPSGCIVWIMFDQATLALGPFLWYGASPGDPLPDIAHLPVGRHTRRNAGQVRPIRQNIRVLPKRLFTPLVDTSALIEHLFGPLAQSVISRNS